MEFYLVKVVNNNVEVELLKGFSDYISCYDAMTKKGFSSFNITKASDEDKYLKIYVYKDKDGLEIEHAGTCNTLAFKVYGDENYLYDIKTEKLIPFKDSFWNSRFEFKETSALLEIVSLRIMELIEKEKISDKNLKELEEFAKENGIPFSAEFIKSFTKTLNEKYPSLIDFWNSSSAYC